MAKPTTHGNVFEVARQARSVATRTMELADAAPTDPGTNSQLTHDRLAQVSRLFNSCAVELHSVAESMPGGADADDGG